MPIQKYSKFPGATFGFPNWDAYISALPNWPIQMYVPIAAMYASRSVTMIEQACRDGELPFSSPSTTSPKVIRRADLDAWLAEQKPRRTSEPTAATRASLQERAA